MKIAIDEARNGMMKNHGGPFGAVIVRNGTIVSKGHNMVLKTKDPTAHAEVIAIRRAAHKLKRFNLSDCSIYTVSEPCPMCMGAILWAGIKRIVYGCTIQDAEKIGFGDSKYKSIICGRQDKTKLKKKQALRNECLILFKEWIKKPNKTQY